DLHVRKLWIARIGGSVAAERSERFVRPELEPGFRVVAAPRHALDSSGRRCSRRSRSSASDRTTLRRCGCTVPARGPPHRSSVDMPAGNAALYRASTSSLDSLAGAGLLRAIPNERGTPPWSVSNGSWPPF